METNTILLIVAGILLGAIIGFIVAKVLEKNKASKLIREAKRSAGKILKEAKSEGENLKKDKILQAKERFIELKANHEKVILSRDKKMAEAEKRTRDKESQISSELAKNKKINQEIDGKIKDYNHRLDYLDKKQDKIIASGVSSTIISTPVAASRALMFRPSLPIIRPLTSSDSMLNTDTQLSTASSVPTR